MQSWPLFVPINIQNNYCLINVLAKGQSHTFALAKLLRAIPYEKNNKALIF
jgi:hypothetical protein